MTKLYLARHGQTYFNVEDRLGGDSGLTPVGFAHAEKVASWLKGVSLDALCSSGLKRSIQTAEIVRQFHPELIVTKCPQLNEVSSGDMDSMSYADFKSDFPNLFEARNKDKFGWAFPNGESYETGLARVMPAIEGLLSVNGTIAFVGHQAVNRLILGHLLDLPKAEIPHLVIPNDVLFVVEGKTVYHIKEGVEHKGYVVGSSGSKADV